MTAAPILVTGATGAQGGAVVASLLAAGAPVRALVRDPDSPKARQLAARGVTLTPGDFDDFDSLLAATNGVYGLFSMQNPPMPDDMAAEIRTGYNLVRAALANGVETVVHTSVARAGDHQHFAGWAEGRWFREYWLSKAAVNDMVRQAGFPRWLILKPALLMANFLPPRAAHMWPSLGASGELATAVAAGTQLDLIDVADVGHFAAAAFAAPDRFHGAEIDLAGDKLTVDEIAATIARTTGRAIPVRHISAEEALANGGFAGVVRSDSWCNAEGYKVDLAWSRSHGIALSSFAQFAERHAEDFVIG